MSLVDKLRLEREKPQAIWLQFLSAYQNKSYSLYVFFEGNWWDLLLQIR